MLKQDEQDRRQEVRVDFDTEVTVRTPAVTSTYSGSSRDLSLRSVFIKTKDMLELDTPCHVEIRLTGLDSELLLLMEGHVVRIAKDGYAIYFDSVDLDSYTHLKNVVKYNAPDPDQM